MAEQISSDNVNKILLEGNAKAQSEPIVAQRPKRYSKDVIVENSIEKRYLWTARAFAIVFAISLCCNVILTYAINKTLPLYRVEPYLLSFADKEEQIYTVIPVNKIYDNQYLTELFVREYVILYNTIISDDEEMEKRWGGNSKIREMSTNKVYREFEEKWMKPNLENIRLYNITRNIKISSVTEVGSAQGQRWWQVEFRAFDMNPERETPDIKDFQANIKIDYRAKKVHFGERLKNPLGFTVTEYGVMLRRE